MKDITIICFGDSLTFGYGVSEGVGYVDRLKEYLGKNSKANFKVLNRGISGNTTREGVERLSRHVLKYNPDLVFVLFGSNDSAMLDGQYRTPYEFKNNISKIAESITSQGGKCVLLTPTPLIEDTFMPYTTMDRIEAYGNIVKEVASEKGLELIDLFDYFMKKTGGDLEEYTQYDGAHLSKKGYDLFFECIKAYIDKYIETI